MKQRNENLEFALKTIRELKNGENVNLSAVNDEKLLKIDECIKLDIRRAELTAGTAMSLGGIAAIFGHPDEKKGDRIAKISNLKISLLTEIKKKIDKEINNRNLERISE